MRTYKIEFEIVLKDNQMDWIQQSIEKQLESNEFVDEFKITEVK
jgi:2-oxoglutarate dehydrogenase complex dehydrogenase (E1) component-like enzyme